MDKQSEFVEKISAQIVQWEAEMDRLQYQVETTASDEEREACLYRMEELRRKRDEAQATLQGIGTENVDAMDDLKEGGKGVMRDVKRGLRDAILKVK